MYRCVNSYLYFYFSLIVCLGKCFAFRFSFNHNIKYEEIVIDLVLWYNPIFNDFCSIYMIRHCFLCFILLHSIYSFASWELKQLIFIQLYLCANVHVSYALILYVCVRVYERERESSRSTWPISFFSLHIFTLSKVDELLNRHRNIQRVGKR